MKKIALLLTLISTSFCFSQQLMTKKQKNIQVAQRLSTKHLKSNHIPGMAITVSKKGQVIWSQGFGYYNKELKYKVSPSETQFRIASISKSITAAALGKLIDDGKLDLDQSLYTYLPDFPKKKYDFSIRQIGGHIAGIRHYNGKEFILNKKMSITEGVNIFKDDALLFEPGTKYKYSTYGWNLLSEVIQKVAKTPFNDYMQAQIFEPLKMRSTTLDLSNQLMVNRTQFYIKTNSNKVILGPEVSNEHKVAGGGFIATSEDLVRFGNEIISPTLITKATLAQLLTPQKTNDGKSTNYGVGFAIGTNSLGNPKYSHSGGGIGASTLLIMYPKEQVVIAIVMNLSQAPSKDFSKALEKIFVN